MVRSDGVSGIELLWIPLGAGGSGVVRASGRIYERIAAVVERRRPMVLLHTALRVRVPTGAFVIETMWPSPPGDPAERGVVVQAPVFSKWFSGTRVFRYEVRRWLDGTIPDIGHAIGGPRRLDHSAARARRLLDSVEAVPALTWGRDRSGVGDMWNSNSVIAWLLARCGLDMGEIHPPPGCRAPGWAAGVAVAASAAGITAA